MRNKIAYVLATILCFSGCTTTDVAPVSPQIIEEVKTHTYLDEFVFDPYPAVGSVNFKDGGLIGSIDRTQNGSHCAHVAEVSDKLMFVDWDGDKHYVSK